jgi:hypothetical protein
MNMNAALRGVAVETLHYKPEGRGFDSLYLFHTPLLTAWNIVLEKLTGLQLVKKFPVFYGTRRFITTFTSALTCLYP